MCKKKLCQKGGKGGMRRKQGRAFFLPPRYDRKKARPGFFTKSINLKSNRGVSHAVPAYYDPKVRLDRTKL